MGDLQDKDGPMSFEPTDAQIDAAIAVLREEVELGGYARSSEFTGPDALERLKDADQAAEAALRDLIRRALIAASTAVPDDPKDSSE